MFTKIWIFLNVRKSHKNKRDLYKLDFYTKYKLNFIIYLKTNNFI